MFNNKEERVLIEQLNEILGMDYRTKPFDFTKTTDLIETATMVSAEYFDLAHYWSTLSEIDENFDESLETFSQLRI